MALKVVIVGGVAGGASAAARLRRLDESAEIILFEKGEYISFANCGLPYYIGEVIREKEKLVVQTPARMKERFNLDIRVNSEVMKIHPEQKTVEVYDKASGRTYTETYDKLILSPGAEPVRPRIPGADSPLVFTLRNIPDTYRIKDYVDTEKPSRAMIVGGGFIGLEMAENLHLKGIDVTIVELADQVISPLDFDMAALVHQHLKAKNVKLYLTDGVKSILQEVNTLTVELSSGRRMKTGMVILGIGVRPEARLAAEAGLKLGQTGGILTDAQMRTSDPDIYAVGDAVEVRDFITGNSVTVPLAGPANRQGRMAADNICGRGQEYRGTQGTAIAKVFDISVAVTGKNEKSLKAAGVNYMKSHTHSASHAGYYPGSTPMSVKLLFAPEDGRILGAQVVGEQGVDKRIDVLATAIRAGMTVFDLETLELAYAPPYSSAKDPVNIAGNVAANMLRKDCEVFHWDEIPTLDREKSVLVDVRTRKEFGLGTLEGALNLPVDSLRNNLQAVPKDKDMYIFCQVGLRGYLATRILLQNGFKNVKNLSGGYKTFHAATQKQSNEDDSQCEVVMKDDEIRTVDCSGYERK